MTAIIELEEVRKSRPRLPVIFLTARGEEEDRVRGLRGGADDYVVKPFSSTELLARVEAVLRRSAERPEAIQTLQLRRDLLAAVNHIFFRRRALLARQHADDPLSDAERLEILDLDAELAALAGPEHRSCR